MTSALEIHLDAAAKLTRRDVRVMLDAEGAELEMLYARADQIRRDVFGDTVPIRVIIEISNCCANHCLYCGIRAEAPLHRYAIPPEEILSVVRDIAASPLAGTVVLQGGETHGHGDDEITRLILEIKTAAPHLAITVSLGNRAEEVYAAWRDAGMDRYLLRFETSAPDLFARIHPDCTLADRLACLESLKHLGVQTGSGFMVGIPGETRDILADNLLLCRDGRFAMLGIGPFIPAENTPFACEWNAYSGDSEMPWRAVAILRILNPAAHIPATTALDALRPDGRVLALQRGANVYMPNATPAAYKADYHLYANKPRIDADWQADALARLRQLNRRPAPGPSHAL